MVEHWTDGDLFNIVRFELAGVPAGTSALEVTLVSSDAGGDSVAMVGMAAHYEGGPLNSRPKQRRPKDTKFPSKSLHAFSNGLTFP